LPVRAPPIGDVAPEWRGQTSEIHPQSLRSGQPDIPSLQTGQLAAEGDAFEILLIPHTLAVTTWGERKAGDRVNI